MWQIPSFAGRRPPISVPTPGCTRNRFEMYDAMLHRTPTNIGGVVGLINAIRMEDGSGHSFIVELSVNCTTHKVYVKG